MPNTPVASRPQSALPIGAEVSERELTEMLQRALEPSFVLVRRLGRGGMGIVFLARDPALKRHVAVKVMSPDRAADPEARARFQREAEAVAAITHPNVVAIYSVGTLENDLPYLVMQYVDGPTMADRLAIEGPLDLEGAKQVIGQVASALNAAHRKGIIHRDVKASNILWDETTGRALVTDFGIAAVDDRDFDGESLRLTQAGTSVGTPQYMSPEQLLSERVTEKTDIYSLGLLGYELLAGEGPYQAPTSPAALVAAHLRDRPRPLSQLRPDADPVLESILASCLEKDAGSRPAAEDIARRLQHAASVLIEWPPPGLEPLHGAAPKVINQVLLGALALSVPVVVVATTDPGSTLRPGWPLSMTYPLLGAMGALTAVAGTVSALRLLRGALRAARAGYGWGIISEVLVDSGRDTGSVIAGEREYASLTPEQRNDVRQWRVQRWALRGGAALWALLGPLAGLPIAARMGGGPSMLSLWALGVPLAALVASEVVAFREWKLLRPMRARIQKHRETLERLASLASTWMDSFDRVAQGVLRGHGRIGGVARRAVIAGALTATLAFSGIMSFGLLAVSTVAESAASPYAELANDFSERFARTARLEKLRAPIDESITPARAGAAFHSLEGAPRYRHRLVVPAPTVVTIPVPIEKRSVEFGGIWMEGNAMRAARRGLNPVQRRFLEEIAATPGSAEFSVLAHARRMDWVAAAVKRPIVNASPYGMPVPQYQNFRSAARANLARAVLALERGQPARAEQLLRENIGAGFALLDGPTLLENLYGDMAVKEARAELVALYEVTGRAAEARAIASGTDPDRGAMISTTTTDPVERDFVLRQAMLDPANPRGARWEIAAMRFAYRPCSDMRQVVFGPNEQHYADLAAARQALVRTEGEAVLMDVADHALERPPEIPRSLPMRVFGRIMRALTGSKRAESCAALMDL